MSAEPTDHNQRIAATLRAATSRASDLTCGGAALAFASPDGAEDLRLRTASGFARAEDARDAAAAVLDAARQSLADGETVEVPTPSGLQERGAAGVHLLPLRHGKAVYGVLAAAFPAAPTAETTRSLGALADDLALRLGYEHLDRECTQLREKLADRDGSEEDESEEVLKLSEALFAQDIELLRSNEKLGKIERLKNDFIEKMSRELRTPLNSIIEGIIAVMTGEHDTLSESSKSILRNSLDEGTAFLRTLQNILDLWRIKQGELPVETQDVNFRELVDEAIFSVQDGLGDKPLCIEPRLSETFPRIRTDLAKVSQILFLLLDNAAKFTPAGEIEISATVDEERLSCCIRDTGIGICPDDQQFIFDEFYQVDEPSSHRYRGAGLGLALVRDLIVLLEGEVMVSSEAGRGTTVTFEVPL